MAMRELVTKDLSWKLFSLGLATVIWFTVRPISREASRPVNPLSASVTRVLPNLPVVIMSSAAGVRAFKVMPDAVAITVRGEREVVAALTDKDIRVTVDLTEVESARGLQARVAVAVPPGVTFIEAIPPQVNVIVPPKLDSEKK